MSESIRQLIASQPLGVPADVQVALAILDASDMGAEVRTKANDVVKEYLTTYMKPINTRAMAILREIALHDRLETSKETLEAIDNLLKDCPQ